MLRCKRCGGELGAGERTRECKKCGATHELKNNEWHVICKGDKICESKE